MILDATLRFAREKALATGNTDTIDMVKGGNALADEPLIIIRMTEAAAGGTTATFALATSDTENFASAKTLFSTSAVPTASLTAGAEIAAFRVPRGVMRYLRGQVTAAGTFTAGKFDMYMVNAEPKSYHDL